MENMPFNSWAYTGFLADSKLTVLIWKIPAGTPPGNLPEQFFDYQSGLIVPVLHEIMVDNPTNSNILFQLAKYQMVNGKEVKCTSFRNNGFDIESEDCESNTFMNLLTTRKIGITPRVVTDIDKDYTVTLTIREL